jgi:hypothetical protein
MADVDPENEKLERETGVEVCLFHADGRENIEGVFLPGEEVVVEVTWDPQSSFRGFDLRLVWETDGKGTDDRETVLRETWESELRGEMKKSVRWILPRGPLSCDGSLLRIRWFVDCYINPAGIRARRDVVLSSTGAPVVLPKGKDDGEIEKLLNKFIGSRKAP